MPANAWNGCMCLIFARLTMGWDGVNLDDTCFVITMVKQSSNSVELSASYIQQRRFILIEAVHWTARTRQGDVLFIPFSRWNSIWRVAMLPLQKDVVCYMFKSALRTCYSIGFLTSLIPVKQPYLSVVSYISYLE
ncbi:hypothetical protein BC939DRAFT_196727 [Gamsiella multidivaricata]|uniref:uncharacterized protein n=1 Tax=Gamsiella multidivaricata TaxID=101098 RepID=UPI00221F6BB8|nr:uncharacterized protein BC939DRAFT_196727 [Gamsiella multidivaricata]KAI7822053.1 hypothetical protein BC939DRAFT_196727 [Gamsiella multidivaricata]